MMKNIFILLAVIFAGGVHAQLTNREIRDLKSGRTVDDTSYMYWLPFQKGHSYLFVQGANSRYSHKGELSYDFKMKKGSEVCAARSGVVKDSRGDSNKGGLHPHNISEGNFVIVQHDDGSEAWYWHLEQNGALVKKGDSVVKGQVIGLSGNTGYTAFPHLHFQVFDAAGRNILVRFCTRKRNPYLRPGRWYKRI
jgi:murein DD-endopeptidase MepM/ murein hydrolase activator NlpD